MCMFHTSIKYFLLHTSMCVWEHACLAAWHWLMVMISLESLSLVSNISVSHALEMTIIFYYPTLELFCFLFTQPFTYSKFSLPNPFLFGANPRHK
jgi:hypothetical protein